MLKCGHYLVCLFLAAALAGCDLKPDGPAAKKKDEPAAKKPAETAPPAKAHKVAKGPFRIEVTLKGIFEAEQMTEIALRPEGWTPDVRASLTVLKAAEHGTAVKKGDTILALDLEKIGQMIKDLKTDRHLADMALNLAQQELPLLAKATPLDLAAAEKADKIVAEDLKKFLEVDRDFSVKNAHHSVKSAANYLEYAKEELKQLEKMYRADDLREETEEIILKRQRNAVESATHYLKQAELHRDETLKVELPRKERRLKDAAAQAALSLERARATLPLTLTQKRVALAKQEYDRGKAVRFLEKLERDREAMTVKAPVDGIVYHGQCRRGQWNTATVTSKLQRGGVIAPDEVVLTIVTPRPLFVRAVVEEKDLEHVRVGMPGKTTPAPFPDLKLPSKVERVSAIPISPGSYEAKISFDAKKGSEALMPGMACTVNLVPYLQLNALTVPAKAVFADEIDDDKHYVYLAGKNGKHEKRTVVTGKTSGDLTEVVTGLHEGDAVLLEKPATAATAGG
jgi:multidrug efflux pump subunit AcrA (membrane-fusion protein)